MIIGVSLLLVIGMTMPVTASSRWTLLTIIRDVRHDDIPTNTIAMTEAIRRAREIVHDFSHDGASHRFAEIIAWNAYPDKYAEGACVSAWLHSLGHRSILLGRWSGIGVGMTDSGVKHFCVALFVPFKQMIAPPVMTPTLPPTDTN